MIESGSPFNAEDDVGRAEQRGIHDDLMVVQMQVQLDIELIEVNLMIRVGTGCC